MQCVEIASIGQAVLFVSTLFPDLIDAIYFVRQRQLSDQQRSFNVDNQMPASDWEPTFTWSLTLAAFDDKAELQEFEPTAPKPSSTIA